MLDCHPNPAGRRHPLIWSPGDPKKPVSYTALNKAFKRAWRAAFGTDCPRGIAFHGFCRTTCTTLPDEVGFDKAAEFTGRTPETIRRFYKKIRMAKQVETADALDRARGGRARGQTRPRHRNDMCDDPGAESVNRPPAEGTGDSLRDLVILAWPFSFRRMYSA